MILDERTEFADAATPTGAAGTQNVGDVIDLEVARDVGSGHPIYLYVLVTVAPTGADTVEFRLVSDSTEVPSTDGSESLHWTSGAVAIADLPVGTVYMIALPLEGVDYERYLGFQVANVGASSLASLEVSAGLTLDPRKWEAYADAVN